MLRKGIPIGDNVAGKEVLVSFVQDMYLKDMEFVTTSTWV